MGAGVSSRHAQLSLTDPKVCRSFLVGTCPHDLFTNTKQDLGQCPKVHSEPLKSEYESSPEKTKFGFEYDYMRDMQKYIDECNRRIDAAQRRLEKTPDEIRQTNDLVSSQRLFSAKPFPSENLGLEIAPLAFHSFRMTPTRRKLTPPSPPAQTNLRPLPIHKHRPSRDQHPRRIREHQHRRIRILQDPHGQSRKRRQRTRTQIPFRHLWSLGPPKAASVRRLWRIPEPTGQRPSSGGPFLRQDAPGLCADAKNVGKSAA